MTNNLPANTGKQVQFIVQGDPTCRGATKSVHPAPQSPCFLEREDTALRSLCAATGEEPLLAASTESLCAATKTQHSQKYMQFLKKKKGVEVKKSRIDFKGKCKEAKPRQPAAGRINSWATQSCWILQRVQAQRTTWHFSFLQYSLLHIPIFNNKQGFSTDLSAFKSGHVGSSYLDKPDRKEKVEKHFQTRVSLLVEYDHFFKSTSFHCLHGSLTARKTEPPLQPPVSHTLRAWTCKKCSGPWKITQEKKELNASKIFRLLPALPTEAFVARNTGEKGRPREEGKEKPSSIPVFLECFCQWPLS